MPLNLFEAATFESQMALLVCLWYRRFDSSERLSENFDECMVELTVKVMEVNPYTRGSSASRFARNDGRTSLHGRIARQTSVASTSNQSQVLYYGKHKGKYLDASVIINATALATGAFKNELFDFPVSSFARSVQAQVTATPAATTVSAATTAKAEKSDDSQPGLQIAVIVVACLFVFIMITVIAIFVRERRKQPSLADGLNAQQLEEWKMVTEALRNVPQSAYAEAADWGLAKQTTDWNLSKQALEAHAAKQSLPVDTDTAVVLADHGLNMGWSDHLPITEHVTAGRAASPHVDYANAGRAASPQLDYVNAVRTGSPQIDSHSYLDVKSNMSRVLSPSPNAESQQSNWRPLTLYSEGAEELQAHLEGVNINPDTFNDPPRSVSAFVETPQGRERDAHSAVNAVFLESPAGVERKANASVNALFLESPAGAEQEANTAANAAFLESPQEPAQAMQLESLKLMRDLCQDQLSSAEDSTIDLELLRYAQTRIEADLQGYIKIGDDDGGNERVSEARPDGIVSPRPASTTHFHPGSSLSTSGPEVWRSQSTLPTAQLAVNTPVATDFAVTRAANALGNSKPKNKGKKQGKKQGSSHEREGAKSVPASLLNGSSSNHFHPSDANDSATTSQFWTPR